MSHPCVGIDLGTTYSGIAVINPAGKPEIVPISEGERITRSAVYFQESGPVIVGQDAVNAMLAYYERVAVNAKRGMGIDEWTFPKDGLLDGRSYSAEEISAMILKKIKQDAEATLGPIKYAVISVPAYFDEARRVATQTAAKLAGIEVLRIINEPTAAAIAYASSGGKPGTVLIYDFGGGTFDVSIVKINDISNIEVIASEGDHNLGGVDLDIKLASHWAELFSSEKGIRANEQKGTWVDWIQTAESDKRMLSRREELPRMLYCDSETMNIKVSRATFEDLIADEIMRTQMLVENALDEARLKPEDIDEVILVGGSTRIPAVQKMMESKFGKKPNRSVNPDEVVALGAAIQSGMIMNERGLADLTPDAAKLMSASKLRDAAAHSLGTIILGEVGGVPRLRNHIMIHKNTPFPVTKKDVFYTIQDGQDVVECIVTQGEDEDPEFVKTLIPMKELPLPSGRPAGQPVEVCYSYDADEIMKYTFTDVNTGESITLVSDDALKSQKKFEHIEADFDDLELE